MPTAPKYSLMSLLKATAFMAIYLGGLSMSRGRTDYRNTDVGCDWIGHR
jgi:hypothetical protein